MNILHTNNTKLLELLESEGVQLKCSDNMDIIILSSVDELDNIVRHMAPAAAGDYSVEFVPDV